MKPDECYRPATRACWPDLPGYSARGLGLGSPGLVERPQRPGRPVHLTRGRRPRFPPVCRGIGACERENQRTARSRRRQWAARPGAPGAKVRRAAGTARTIGPRRLLRPSPTRERLAASGSWPLGRLPVRLPHDPVPGSRYRPRRSLAVLAALVLVVALAACGARGARRELRPRDRVHAPTGASPARTRSSRRCCRQTYEGKAPGDGGLGPELHRARARDPRRARGRRGPVRRRDVAARRHDGPHRRRVRGRRARPASDASTFYEDGARTARRTEKLVGHGHDRRRARPRSASTSSAATARARRSSPGRPRSPAASTSCSPQTSATRRSRRRSRRSPPVGGADDVRQGRC